VAGDLGVIAFDEHAEIVASARPRPGGEDVGVEVPAGLFHTVVALAPDTVVLEVKEGLCPESGDKDFSPLFPEEGSPERGELLARWCALFTR
jgi:cupin fold WbuC family metalloprotein